LLLELFLSQRASLLTQTSAGLNSLRLITAQQLRELGDVRRDPPRFVLRIGSVGHHQKYESDCRSVHLLRRCYRFVARFCQNAEIRPSVSVFLP